MEREIEFPLAGFTGGKNGRVTDVAKRVLSNRDACLLLLAANGPICKTGVLRRLLQAWRPLEGLTYRYNAPQYRPGKHELHFTYLFNSYYGHITTNSHGRPLKNWCESKPRTKVAYFWSNKRGEIKITVEGYKRLAWLIQEMGRECCLPDCIALLDMPTVHS